MMKGWGQSHRLYSLGSRESESSAQDVYKECPWDQNLWKEGEGGRIGRGEVKLQCRSNSNSLCQHCTELWSKDRTSERSS